MCSKFGYDDDGQLQSSLGYTSGGTPIAAEQLGYGYDPGWNMTNRSVNGVGTTYTVNDLNQAVNDGSGAYYFDANGNRTNRYGAWKYTYDDENRLTLVSDDSGHTFRTGFTYDGLGRLRVRQVYMWLGQYSLWVTTVQYRYLYDGNRVVQERDNANTPIVAYTRGSDLSGSLEGAGGIGGLLARSHGYSGGNWTTHNLYHADGNGNVTYLLNPSVGMVASYKYDPYGRTLSSSGSLAGANVYRFSSKEIHAESGMYYYLYRFFDPNVQRWVNRDPAFEDGGFNLYCFNLNRPVILLDSDGRASWPPSQSPSNEQLGKCNSLAQGDIPTPGSGRYGDCTKQQYQQLNSAIGKACKDSGKMHCFKGDDCATIKLKIARFDACIRAREIFNDTCWSGESSIELNEIRNSKRGRDNCQKLFCEKNCK